MMSEPMSNHEIEDVLSSIRRLVSEDLRPAPRAPEPEAEPGPEVKAEDKLLLTPALRVVTQPDRLDGRQDSDAQVFAQPDAAAEVAPVTEAAAPVEDVVARLGAAVAEEEWESPFGDPEVWSSAPAVADQPAGDAAQGFAPRARMTFDARPEDLNDDMPADFIEAPMAAFAEAEDVLPEAAFAASTAPRDAVRKVVTPPRDENRWADEAEAAVHADLAQETEDEVISGLYDAQAGGMAFDEEVLRDLVRDLIREELSGTLGERITRNVRKLVRAEIARAMALREFE